MAWKYYEFTIVLGGYGKTSEDGWDSATENIFDGLHRPIADYIEETPDCDPEDGFPTDFALALKAADEDLTEFFNDPSSSRFAGKALCVIGYGDGDVDVFLEDMKR